MATINLGNIKFTWQGAYNANTAYAIDDVVSYNGSSYVCIQASTGNLPTVTTHWNVMSQAGTNGTNGTDVGTTITTQGDILYRDGSGLARLGYGTAGQVLQTGGSGANPSWGTVSSDFVKLTSATDINTSSYNVDGFFSSTYHNYMFVFNTVRSSSNGDMYIRVNHGGSEYSSSSYNHAMGQAYRDSSGSAWSSSASGWGATEYRYSADSHGNSKSGQLVIMVQDPLTTNGQHHITGDFNYMRGSDGATHQRVYSGCTVNDTTAVTGLRFYTSSGNFKADHFALYGMKA